MRSLLLLLPLLALACGTCPAQDEIVPILPPADGDASVAADLPTTTGDVDQAECVRRCGASVLACTFDEPGGVPTFHCVMPSSCE